MAFQLTIVTPEGAAWEGTAERAVLPGTEGDFGVLPGHEPFLTALRIGPAEIDTGSETLLAAISGGFAEVHADSVTVMVSSCEFAHEIDLERAELAQQRAKRMLEEMRDTEEGEAAYAEYQEAYSRSLTRLAVSKQQEKFKH